MLARFVSGVMSSNLVSYTSSTPNSPAVNADTPTTQDIPSVWPNAGTVPNDTGEERCSQKGGLMADFHCRCGATWTGQLTMHCCSIGGCGRLFTGLSAFDRHRTGSHSKGRFCLDPETVINDDPESPRFGQRIFQDAERKYPCWTLAEKPDA